MQPVQTVLQQLLLSPPRTRIAAAAAPETAVAAITTPKAEVAARATPNKAGAYVDAAFASSASHAAPAALARSTHSIPQALASFSCFCVVSLGPHAPKDNTSFQDY